jgi:DNA invertase Pin-like site-specific DNA recombinase
MKAVIFVRVSRKDQDYQRQIADLEAVAKQKGYTVAEVITEKISGAKKNKERPSIQHLMNMAKDGAFQTVLVSEISRLGRNTREVINVFEDLNDIGVNIYLHNFGMETIVNGKRNPMLQMLIPIMAEFARMERQHLVERTKSGLENAKRQGKTLGRPVGTTKGDKDILEEYPSIVRSLKKGLSIREAAKVNDVAPNTVVKVKKAMNNN